MTILTDEDIGELKRDYGFGICDLNWWEATRAIESAVIEKIKARGAVAEVFCDGVCFTDYGARSAEHGTLLYRIED